MFGISHRNSILGEYSRQGIEAFGAAVVTPRKRHRGHCRRRAAVAAAVVAGAEGDADIVAVVAPAEGEGGVLVGAPSPQEAPSPLPPPPFLSPRLEMGVSVLFHHCLANASKCFVLFYFIVTH